MTASADDALPMWVVYDHPSDYPETYIARQWLVGPDGQQATEELNRHNDRGACWLDLAREDCFHALYAAAFGLGRELHH